MIDFKLKSLQAGFFDRKAVMDRVDKARRKVLSKFGSFVRQRARTSIRKKQGISPPLGPPHSHTGLLRKFLFFAYDRTRESVVVGPARLNAVASRGKAPALLEYGGTAAGSGRTIYAKRGVGRDASGRFTSRGRDEITLTGTLRYRPRPFMQPALEKERPQLPRLWKDSVR